MKALQTIISGCVVLSGSVGCGSNPSEIPPELLDAIRARESGGSGDYPEGPYGTEIGDVAQNFCFEGWRDPTRITADEVPPLEKVCFGDFYDPSGESVSYLLVNAAAVWCTACKAEYRGSATRPSLPEALDAREDRGFRILGTLFQDAANNPATLEDAVTWVRAYDVDFPFVLDKDFKLGAYTPPAQAPYNMVLDARTMEIVLQFEGDQPAVLFGRLDELLDAL